MDPLSLTPLANLMKVEEFKIGQYIIREGQVPKHFFLIAEGCCKTINEKTMSRPSLGSPNIQGLVPKKRRLDFAGDQLQSLEEVKELRRKEEAPDQYMEGYISSMEHDRFQTNRTFQNDLRPSPDPSGSRGLPLHAASRLRGGERFWGNSKDRRRGRIYGSI